MAPTLEFSAFLHEELDFEEEFTHIVAVPGTPTKANDNDNRLNNTFLVTASSDGVIKVWKKIYIDGNGNVCNKNDCNIDKSKTYIVTHSIQTPASEITALTVRVQKMYETDVQNAPPGLEGIPSGTTMLPPGTTTMNGHGEFECTSDHVSGQSSGEKTLLFIYFACLMAFPVGTMNENARPLTEPEPEPFATAFRTALELDDSPSFGMDSPPIVGMNSELVARYRTSSQHQDMICDNNDSIRDRHPHPDDSTERHQPPEDPLNIELNIDPIALAPYLPEECSNLFVSVDRPCTIYASCDDGHVYTLRDHPYHYHLLSEGDFEKIELNPHSKNFLPPAARQNAVIEHNQQNGTGTVVESDIWEAIHKSRPDHSGDKSGPEHSGEVKHSLEASNYTINLGKNPYNALTNPSPTTSSTALTNPYNAPTNPSPTTSSTAIRPDDPYHPSSYHTRGLSRPTPLSSKPLHENICSGLYTFSPPVETSLGAQNGASRGATGTQNGANRGPTNSYFLSTGYDCHVSYGELREVPNPYHSDFASETGNVEGYRTNMEAHRQRRKHVLEDLPEQNAMVNPPFIVQIAHVGENILLGLGSGSVMCINIHDIIRSKKRDPQIHNLIPDASADSIGALCFGNVTTVSTVVYGDGVGDDPRMETYEKTILVTCGSKENILRVWDLEEIYEMKKRGELEEGPPSGNQNQRRRQKKKKRPPPVASTPSTVHSTPEKMKSQEKTETDDIMVSSDKIVENQDEILRPGLLCEFPYRTFCESVNGLVISGNQLIVADTGNSIKIFDIKL